MARLLETCDLEMNYIQLIVSLATHFGWTIHQMDVKSAFLHGDLSKQIYMEKPPSFVKDFSLVCQLKSI